MIKTTVNDHESKKMSWKDFLTIISRRRWWLMGPLLGLGLLGSLAADLWPELYRSEALILVEQQKVPEQFVTPNVIADMQDRLESMTQQILSRTRLKALIDQFNLYRRDRSRLTMDEVIDEMRKNIQVELVQNPGRPGDLTAFKLSFSAENPRVTQQVASQLTSMVIEENLEDRAQESVNTTDFLENQLQDATKKLADQEAKLSDYKSRFLGELPEQEQSNLQILGSLEAQLQGANNQLERTEQEKTYLESLQAGYKASSGPIGPSGGTMQGHYANPDDALRDLHAQLTDLEAKYTPKHPDVIWVKDQIAMWEARKRSAAGGMGADGAKSGDAYQNPAMVDINSRLKAITAETQSRRRDVAHIRTLLRNYQSRLNMTPVREQQLAEVTRDYQNARQDYESLLQKKQQSALATNLEKRQQGERLRLIDPPTLPEKPVEPNRVEIVLAGWLAGLCLALSMAASREFTDNTLHSEEDLEQCAPLPVLVRLPLLLSPSEENRKRRFHFLEMAGAVLLFVVSVGTGVFTCWVS